MTDVTVVEISEKQKSAVRTYLVYQCLSSLIFISTVWLYFYRIFITDAQVGILDGLAFFIGIIAEVPSGVLADKFGRGRISRLGLILTAVGVLIQAFGSSFMSFLIGQSVTMIGVSLTSGADEALFFSKINFDRTSSQWRKLILRGAQMSLIGTLAAILIGGWLHTINPRLPWILTGIASLASALLIWPLKDSEIVKEKMSLGQGIKDHLNEIRNGFACFCSGPLLRYVPYLLTVQGLFYMIGLGLLRIILLDRFHFDPFLGSVVVAVCNLSTVAALSFIHHHAEKISEKLMLSVVALSAAVGLLVSVADIGVWGVAVILSLYAGERVLYPFLSEILHNSACDEQRATILSVASFFKALPYVALAPIIGALNTYGKLDYFLVVWPVLIIAALLFYLSQAKQNENPARDPLL